MNIGKVAQVIWPVLDVEFPAGKRPAIYNANKIKTTHCGNSSKEVAMVLTSEVASISATT